jgi:hypothetical protein
VKRLALFLVLCLVGCGPSKEDRANRAVLDAIHAIEWGPDGAYDKAFARVREFYPASSETVRELTALRSDYEELLKNPLAEPSKRMKERIARVKARFGSAD